MSRPTDRRRNRLTWAKDRDAELLNLHIRIAMEHQANEAARRARDVKGELASAMRAWFAGELGRLQPARPLPTERQCSR
jgi:hypothetical protein